MAVNKVVLGNRTLIDLTAVTVTPEVLLEGYTAYDASGNLITGTYAPTKENLFDESTAAYNNRIRSNGLLATGGTGKLVTAPIDITNISTLTIEGITEVRSADNFYLNCALYQDSTTFIKQNYYTTAPTYTVDVANLKANNPTATHCRLEIVLSTTTISTADTADLAIYGS